ncbi:MAG: hypothetical protein PHV82_01950, partial [Victivallaceae bacterium]|nr:hypothetical protein [Victivallaceae bacterium]
MRNILLLVGLILLAGCESLPPGKAPDGSIVDAKLTPQEHSWRSAENYLLTSLSAFCLQNFPEGTKVCTDFPVNDSFPGIRSRMVLYSVCDTVPLRVVSRADAVYSLSSRSDKNQVWSMALTELKTEKIVWRESVKIK